MNYIWIIICVIVLLVVVLGLVLWFKNDDVDEEHLSARDYWRWKNGGID